MKIQSLLIGLIIGGLLGFGLNHFLNSNATASKVAELPKTENTADATNWKWADSLDALKAAPENHNIVYEDTNVRILQVILDAQKAEPIHTHKWKSIMWITKPAAPCVIYNYADNKGKFIVSDSIVIPRMETNKGSLIDPENPTSIKNLSSENGIAYRVEFKKEFKP